MLRRVMVCVLPLVFLAFCVWSFKVVDDRKHENEVEKLQSQIDERTKEVEFWKERNKTITEQYEARLGEVKTAWLFLHIEDTEKVEKLYKGGRAEQAKKEVGGGEEKNGETTGEGKEVE